MIKNLLQTGTRFMYSADDQNSEDLLNSEIGDYIDVKDFETPDSEMEFEDEK